MKSVHLRAMALACLAWAVHAQQKPRQAASRPALRGPTSPNQMDNQNQHSLQQQMFQDQQQADQISGFNKFNFNPPADLNNLIPIGPPFGGQAPNSLNPVQMGTIGQLPQQRLLAQIPQQQRFNMEGPQQRQFGGMGGYPGMGMAGSGMGGMGMAGSGMGGMGMGAPGMGGPGMGGMGMGGPGMGGVGMGPAMGSMGNGLGTYGQPGMAGVYGIGNDGGSPYNQNGMGNLGPSGGYYGGQLGNGGLGSLGFGNNGMNGGMGGSGAGMGGYGNNQYGGFYGNQATQTVCSCTLQWDPMCGSDGKTYTNQCQFDCGKRQNSGLQVVSRNQQCAASSGGVTNPVDNVSWQIYDSSTYVPADTCSWKCYGGSSPICATNGTQYASPCHFWRAVCRAQVAQGVSFVPQLMPCSALPASALNVIIKVQTPGPVATPALTTLPAPAALPIVTSTATTTAAPSESVTIMQRSTNDSGLAGNEIQLNPIRLG